MRNKKAEDKRGLSSPIGAKIPHRNVNSQGITKEVTFRDSEVSCTDAKRKALGRYPEFASCRLARSER